MDKEKINKYYEKLVSSLDDMIYLTLILKEIIEKIDNEEDLIQLELDLMYISVTYKYDKEKIIKFRKEIERILNDYNLNIDLISNEKIEELIKRLIIKTNNK